MRGVSVEESETGKFSLWVHQKNAQKIQDTDPDASERNNGSYALSYDVDGRLQYIDLTIGTTTWRKTLAYTSGRLSSISAWVKQ